MILQALVRYYEDLERQGKLAAPGWSPVNVSYVLYLDDQGGLEQVADVRQERTVGKKTVLAPRPMQLPTPRKRASGIVPNFLWDNASYLLGIDAKGKPERTAKCAAACRAWHEQVLAGVTSPAAQALLGFFARWDPAAAWDHPALREYREGLLSGANLTFRHRGQYVAEDPAIRAAWQRACFDTEEGTEGVCLVTGERTQVAVLHPAIKGVAGAQSSGASLVSFNAPAFCSYGHDQGQNAPVGEYAAFAYGAALNHLLADRDHVGRIGDTTVLCWAEGGQPAYQGLFGCCLFGQESRYTEHELQTMMRRLADGRAVDFDETRIEPDRAFYVLGLSPNAARLSVRFFRRNTFGALLRNVYRHHEQMAVVRPSRDPFETVPLWRLLRETVDQNARDKAASPVLSGAVLRAILEGTPYPATLRNAIHLRIRADRTIGRARAAAIKAYYLRASCVEFPRPEEVFTVSLNEQSTNVPYQLGRLFSVLEEIQSRANPGINSTIRDRYFNAASATPAMVFPTLIRLAQKHLKKLTTGGESYYTKQLRTILDRLEEEFPARLTLPEQGAFQLGYYHQTTARYAKNDQEG